MADISRREFSKVVAAAPVAALMAPVVLRAAAPVRLGVRTSSFSDLPRVTGRDSVDDVLRALRAVRATHVELALLHVEPAPPDTAPVMGGSAAYPRRIVLTPEQIAATNQSYRAALRSWRRQIGIEFFEQIRGKFDAAGLTVHACAIGFDDSFTDEEISATFRQVRALGAQTISSPMTLTMAARLVPFAEQHGLSIAIHNQVDGNGARAIATPDLKDALALSPAFKLKLDIGNLTASNRDAIAELRTHQARVSHVLVKDRLRNGGASQPFGEGDTPIAGVLDVLKTSASSIPAFVEYDYVGLHSSVDEVAAALAYLQTIN
jgi:sugar phosphate isomerase/epimerase